MPRRFNNMAKNTNYCPFSIVLHHYVLNALFFLLYLASSCQAFLTKALSIYITSALILFTLNCILNDNLWMLIVYIVFLHCAFTDNICYQTLYLALPRQQKFLFLQDKRLQDGGNSCILVRRGTQEDTFEDEHMPEMKRARLRNSPHRWERNKETSISSSSVHSSKKKAILESHGYQGYLHWAGNKSIFTISWGDAG